MKAKPSNKYIQKIHLGLFDRVPMPAKAYDSSWASNAGGFFLSLLMLVLLGIALSIK